METFTSSQKEKIETYGTQNKESELSETDTHRTYLKQNR